MNHFPNLVVVVAVAVLFSEHGTFHFPPLLAPLLLLPLFKGVQFKKDPFLSTEKSAWKSTVARSVFVLSVRCREPRIELVVKPTK